MSRYSRRRSVVSEVPQAPLLGLCGHRGDGPTPPPQVPAQASLLHPELCTAACHHPVSASGSPRNSLGLQLSLRSSFPRPPARSLHQGLPAAQLSSLTPDRRKQPWALTPKCIATGCHLSRVTPLDALGLGPGASRVSPATRPPSPPLPPGAMDSAAWPHPAWASSPRGS